MKDQIQAQLSETIQAIEEFSDASGRSLAEQIITEAQPILAWIHWYRTHRPPSVAAELLSGSQAAILETASYIGMGLGRACLTAIRLQIDLILGFTYFRDHHVEWDRVGHSGEGFMLRGDIYTYHRNLDRNFTSRLMAIETKACNSLETNYKILSSHIHGQSTFTVPDSTRMLDLIWKGPKLDSIVEMQASVAKSLSNFLMSVHAREWVDLPRESVNATRTLLGDKHKDFFQ